MIYQHFPVLAVMLLFLSAFCVEIFGARNAAVRKVITFIGVTVALVLICALIKPVMLDGEIITYWMGNWEPVSEYAVGIGYEVDQLSLFFALIGVITYWLAAVYSFGFMEGKHHLGHYYTLFLMLSGSTLGLVLTGDIFNMFVMIEILTFSSVALTAFDSENPAALEGGFKYLAVGSVGSSMTLSGIALLYLQCHTLNMAQLSSILSNNMTPTVLIAFGLIMGGFGVKSDMFPFHAPFADANTVAPAPISTMLSGMVTKVGVYGLIRMVYVIFRAMDRPSMQVILVLFGAVTMFAGVTMALAQHEYKRLLAFHSISQVGYIITAIALGSALGVTGGLFHALNHTLFKGLLFLTAGAILSATGTTSLDHLGGLSKKMPKTCICFLIGAFSISGLPPFNGFASKWIIYQAIFAKAVESGNFVFVIAVISALITSVMTLASFIKVTHSVFFGQLHPEHENVKEVSGTMLLPMYIMSALCVLTGVFYDVLYKYILQPAVNATLNVVNYIDSMMGAGYAANAGIANIETAPVTFSFWDPYAWLILFGILFLALCFVILTSNPARGAIREGKAAEDQKYATFFSGEESLQSQAGGSDLFWGFKQNTKGYYRILQGMHSGSVNDYATLVVIATAIFVAFMFIFMH